MADLKLNFIVLVMLLTSCVLPQQAPTSVQVVVQTVVVTTTAVAVPTAVTTQGMTPSPTAQANPTQIPAVTADVSPIKGIWRHITPADGLCTDTPWFIGAEQVDQVAQPIIGTGTQTLCFRRGNDQWISTEVPVGDRVVWSGYLQLMPPGGLLAEMNTGERCSRFEYADDGKTRIAKPQWNCALDWTAWPQGVSRAEVLTLSSGLYRLTDKVVDRRREDIVIHIIAQMAGSTQARVTWVTKNWIGTNSYGIFVINDAQPYVPRHFDTSNGLPSNTIRDISMRPINVKSNEYADVWVATDNGVAKYDGQRWHTYDTSDNLPGNDIRGVSVAANGSVWVATNNGAAYLAPDSQTWIAFTAANGLPTGHLNGVIIIPFAPGDGNKSHTEIWFSTQGDGLIIFTPEA